MGARLTVYGGFIAGAVAVGDVCSAWDQRLTVTERLQLAARRVSE